QNLPQEDPGAGRSPPAGPRQARPPPPGRRHTPRAGAAGEGSMSASLQCGPPAVPTLRGGPCRYGGQPRLLRALPDLVVRVADAGLGVGIALDLDLVLEGLPDLAGRGLGGVLDRLLAVVAVERVRRYPGSRFGSRIFEV